MVVIAESIPSSNLMLPLVSIAHRCLENITQPKQLMLNGDPVASGSPRSWFKRTISLTTWYNVILHVHAVVMIVMMQLLSLSTFSLRSQAKFIHLPARLISWSSHVGVWWFCMVFVSLFTNVWQNNGPVVRQTRLKCCQVTSCSIFYGFGGVFVFFSSACVMSFHVCFFKILSEISMAPQFRACRTGLQRNASF